MTNEHITDPVDKHVGRRIRDARVIRGLTQQGLADLIGVTYQQAHKYEKGINRVAASRLFAIAQAFGLPVGYFFEGLDGQGQMTDVERPRQALELVRNLECIPDQLVRDNLCALVNSLSKAWIRAEDHPAAAE